MSFAISSLGGPTAVFSSGVSRPAGESGLESPSNGALKSAFRFRIGQTAALVSRKNRQEAVLENLKTRTESLTEGLRLFNLPESGQPQRLPGGCLQRPGQFSGRGGG
jgi:hypothetical protein